MSKQRTASRPGGPESAETTVLFVDDESTLLNLWEAVFTGEYDVRTAASGEEALRTFDGSVDVVFLDRRMPGMSGDEVIRRLREEGYATPVIMATAVDPDHEVPAEYDEYVTKPVDNDHARTLIERYAT